jgi:hypothetical protein
MMLSGRRTLRVASRERQASWTKPHYTMYNDYAHKETYENDGGGLI